MTFSAETIRQAWAQGRGYTQYGTGLLTAIGVMSATQQKEFMEGLTQFGNGIALAFQGATSMWIIILAVGGPAVSLWIANRSSKAASTTSQAASIQQTTPSVLAAAMAKAPEVFVQAVKQMSTVQAVITTPDAPGGALAQNVPSTGVVQAGTPEAAALAKAA